MPTWAMSLRLRWLGVVGLGAEGRKEPKGTLVAVYTRKTFGNDREVACWRVTHSFANARPSPLWVWPLCLLGFPLVRLGARLGS